MKAITMTLENYTKQLALGFMEQIKCVSVFKKIVKINDAKGGFEMAEITLKF